MDASKAFYLYGIIDQPESHSVLEELKSPEPIRLLPIQELGALISEVSLEEFGEEVLKTRLRDPKWLESRLRHHEGVLESFMRCGTVIPMKFATIFTTEERLCERLLGLYETLRELRGKLQGKEEWGVKAFCDLRSIRSSIEAEHERAKQLKAQLAGQPSGTAYLMRKQLEELIAREADQRLSQHLRAIHQRLCALVTEVRLNLCTPHELTNRKHEMVLNAALLVEKTQVSRLGDEVRALRQTYAPHGFEFELVGPFPPYNFSRLPEGVAHE